MCGIVAFLGKNQNSGIEFIERSLSLLEHRGPNDVGILAKGDAVLGHRRLSILDLTAAGHQPMSSDNGRWHIVFNGEIYNHTALRQRWCSTWKFHSHSDTETLLALLSLHGARILNELVGMWAFAFWDDLQQSLIVSRDRYGQKPLYWRHCHDGSLRFASEIKPLIHKNESPTYYPSAIAEFLATGNYGHLGEKCFFDDVFVFPAAHWAEVRIGDSRPKAERYWKFPTISSKDRRPYDQQAVKIFRKVFDDAVQSQLLSDVPVGATLSGGLDSSAVVGAIASQRDRTAIFTAQCNNSKYDESHFVNAVEQKWAGKLDIHWAPIRQLRISEFLRSDVRVQEEPLGDASMAAHRQLMQAAQSAGVPVILGGQGGDELLFGYPHMICSLISSSLRQGRLLWALRESHSLKLSKQLKMRIGLSATLPNLERWLRRRARKSYRSLLSKDLQQAAEATCGTWSDANTTQLEAIEQVCLPHLTHYDDRSGMSCSIEGRMPFLDHRIAETIATIDFPGFLNDGYSKRILRDACADLLPEPVATRRDKIGFYTPIRDLLLAELALVRETLLGEFARHLNWYDRSTVQLLVDRLHRQPEASADATLIWRLLSATIWAKEFSVVRPSNAIVLPSRAA